MPLLLPPASAPLTFAGQPRHRHIFNWLYPSQESPAKNTYFLKFCMPLPTRSGAMQLLLLRELYRLGRAMTKHLAHWKLAR